MIAGWSSLVARWAHNPKVVGSNPSPATLKTRLCGGFFFKLLKLFLVKQMVGVYFEKRKF